MLVLFFSVDELTIRKLTEFYFVLLDKFGMKVAGHEGCWVSPYQYPGQSIRSHHT